MHIACDMCVPLLPPLCIFLARLSALLVAAAATWQMPQSRNRMFALVPPDNASSQSVSQSIELQSRSTSPTHTQSLSLSLLSLSVLLSFSCMQLSLVLLT